MKKMTAQSSGAGTGHCLAGNCMEMARHAARLERQGEFEQALGWYRKALESDPRSGKVWLAGGTLLARQGRLEEAAAWLGKAAGDPSCRPPALYNLSRVYKEMGRLNRALETIRLFLDISPGDGEGWNNLGTILMARADTESACRAFEKASALRPEDPLILANFALAQKRRGRLLKAMALAGRANRLAGGGLSALALQAHLFQETFHWRRLGRVLTKLQEATGAALAAGRRPAEPPFLNFTWCMDPARNLAVARAWSKSIARRARRAAGGVSFPHRPGPRRRLTIGYLSGQFRNAATGHLTRSMFRYHDRRFFRVICYSLRPATDDPYCARIAADADRWVELGNLDDMQAAKRIYDDRVDILVDMTGHMEGGRLGICALRPAPVQVHYLGYPATTGADFIDYQIVDQVVAPEAEQRFYSEHLAWLPGCYQVNDDDPPLSAASFSRDQVGLPRDSFVFCSFNTEYKLDPVLFQAWMDILRRTDKGVLWLLVRSRPGRRMLKAMAARRGLDPRRLVFARQLSKPLHLARLSLADLALDTRIVNGHTTTADALHAGLPVVALKGAHFASRVSASLLAAAGLSELVTGSLEDYVALAVCLAREPRRLDFFRQRLARRQEISLFNTRQTVSLLQQAYLKMWQRYAAGRPPASFRV